MENASSTPQLQPVTIPPDWCPAGTFAEVFNAYQNQFLVQTLVLGVSTVSPADLTAIQQELINLQNQITALEKFSRNGTAFVSTGDDTVSISFTAVASTQYSITVLPIGNGTETDPFSWCLIDGSKTTGGFSLRFIDVPATMNSFEWSILQY